MKRDEIYLARLDAVEGSEIGKTRPVVIVSDDLRNQLMRSGTLLIGLVGQSYHGRWSIFTTAY